MSYTKEEFKGAKPEFEVGEIVKVMPVGLVKKIKFIRETKTPYADQPDGYMYGFLYGLEDCFGLRHEYSLRKTNETKVDMSIDRASRHYKEEYFKAKKQLAEAEKVIEYYSKKSHWGIVSSLDGSFVEVEADFTANEYLRKHNSSTEIIEDDMR